MTARPGPGGTVTGMTTATRTRPPEAPTGQAGSTHPEARVARMLVLTLPEGDPGNAAVLTRLATHPDDQTRMAVAAHPDTPPRTLVSMFADANLGVACLALQRPVPAATRGLAGALRRAVQAAAQPESLASMNDVVRGAVAEHGHAPATVLAGLLADPDVVVRAAAASNPRLPAAHLGQAMLGDLTVERLAEVVTDWLGRTGYPHPQQLREVMTALHVDARRDRTPLLVKDALELARGVSTT